MTWSTTHILDILALLFAIASIVPQVSPYPVLAVSVILLAVAGLVG